MKKSLVMALGFVVLAAGAAASVVLRVELLPTDLCPSASGMVVVNYVRGAEKSEVMLICRNLDPDTIYGLYVNLFGLKMALGAFLSDKNGNLRLHYTGSGDWTTDLWEIAIFDVKGGGNALIGDLSAR